MTQEKEAYINKFKSSWVQIFLAIITTGLAGDFLGIWNLRVQREDSYIEKYVQTALSKGEIEIAKSEEVINCQKALLRMETRLKALEMSQGEIPFPYWVKDDEFNIIHLSKQYQRQVLEPLEIPYDSVINTKGEAFGQDFYTTIIANDKQVKRAHELMRFEENLPDGTRGTSYKYPIPTPFGREYYGGIWIPEDRFESQ